MAQLRIQETPEEDLDAVRVQQSFDMTELRALLDAMECSLQEEYDQAHQDEEQRILDYEAQEILNELSDGEWEAFLEPVQPEECFLAQTES
jgi:hypothetical protein